MPRSQFSSAYLGKGIALTTTGLGARMFVDTEDIVAVPHILIDGMWEHWVTTYFLRHPKLQAPGTVFVDVGAHVGWYTLLAAGRGARVIAIEPNPKLAQLVKWSAALNGWRERVTVHNVAATDKAGEATFQLPENGSGNGRIVPDGTAVPIPSKFFDRSSLTSVKTERLDALVSGAVGLVKIDAEGSEMDVIEGAKALLASSPGIELVVEHHEKNIPRMTALVAAGWRLSVIQTNSAEQQLQPGSLAHVEDSMMLVLRR